MMTFTCEKRVECYILLRDMNHDIEMYVRPMPLSVCPRTYNLFPIHYSQPYLQSKFDHIDILRMRYNLAFRFSLSIQMN